MSRLFVDGVMRKENDIPAVFERADLIYIINSRAKGIKAPGIANGRNESSETR
jgi:hypothetical protein